MNFALVEIVYLAAGILAFFVLCLECGGRSRIPVLLLGLLLAAIHLACLNVLAFSYLSTTWTFSGSATFSLLGYGFLIAFTCGGLMSVFRDNYPRMILFIFLVCFNMSPNDQEFAIRASGPGWWLGERLLCGVFIPVAAAALFMILFGLQSIADRAGWSRDPKEKSPLAAPLDPPSASA